MDDYSTKQEKGCVPADQPQSRIQYLFGSIGQYLSDCEQTSDRLRDLSFKLHTPVDLSEKDDPEPKPKFLPTVVGGLQEFSDRMMVLERNLRQIANHLDETI